MPAVARQFIVQLTWRPTGIAQVEAGAPRIRRRAFEGFIDRDSIYGVDNVIRTLR